eukprot:2654398-Rhodomonas_salina.1
MVMLKYQIQQLQQQSTKENLEPHVRARAHELICSRKRAGGGVEEGARAAGVDAAAAAAAPRGQVRLPPSLSRLSCLVSDDDEG